MCGRYALGIRASFIRYQLQQQGLPVDDAPEDDEARETYNFPPGSYGLVYRADVPDHGVRDEEAGTNTEQTNTDEANTSRPAPGQPHQDQDPGSGKEVHEYKYQLKVMKWGLIPFWTKRAPDYGSMMRTINCRDDSLIDNRGMWTTMKQRKRCIVIATGFYEWLKKGPGGKEKIPHYVKRKDGQLMCFAGLWDCVKYEDSEDKLYTYTVITTDPNKQLKFLHDRMPVILDAGSEAMKMWLDPKRNKWSKELQSLLKPFNGELECYPVSKEVGKVGNNSADFIIPIDSKENKKNIANFFGNARKQTAMKEGQVQVEKGEEESQTRNDGDGRGDNAVTAERASRTKRSHSPEEDKLSKAAKMEPKLASPMKAVPTKTRSATSNESLAKKAKSPSKKAAAGSHRITDFLVR